jgi:hypothetical protein
MRATFYETNGFSQWREDFLPDSAYSRLQRELMADPDLGDVMPGCGGLRKLRTADAKRAKGKRGGARVIYLHIPEAKCFYLIDIYGKDEQDDLSAAEKKEFGALARAIKVQAVARYQSWQKENNRDRSS